MNHQRVIRHDLLELASAYAEYSVLVTTAQMEFPGPQILYVNSAFTRMTSYSVQELLGKTPRILQGEKTDQALLKRLRETLTAGHDFIARTINYKRDGTPFELEWIISHLRDANGNTTHYVALQRDITGMERAAHDLASFDDELREASHQLIKTVHKLADAENRLLDRERFAALGEMAAGVVHDISNALTPVFGLVQLLHNIETLPPTVQKLTSSLDKSIEHALDVLANLKHYHRHGSAAVAAPVNLQQLIHGIPDITRARWWSANRQTGNAINFALHVEQPIWVAGNATELTQVVTNLVLNAIESIPEGGTVSMNLSVEGDSAVLSIADTGIGMTPEMTERCFLPYVTARAHGTGLGLSVCRRIIQQHHGTIDVESKESQGSKFTIRLPMVTPAIGAAPSEPRPGAKRVLHIGSNAAEQSEFVRTLQRMGLTVDTATSGDQGLDYFYKSKYDLVIAGANMHPTSGIDVAQSIKRSCPDVPIAVSVDSSYLEGFERLPDYLRPDAVIQTPLTANSLEDVLVRLGLWTQPEP